MQKIPAFLIISFILLSILVQAQSEVSYKIQYMIGNRQAKELDEFLKSLDLGKLSISEICDVVIGYTELYSWGGKGYEYSEKAYNIADRVIKENPKYWKGYYSLAVVLSHRVQKNNLLALTLVGKIDYNLNKAMEYGPNEWEPFFLAGVRNLEVPLFPNLALAEEYLGRSLKNNPNHLYTYYMYGRLFEKKKDYCKALEYYTKVLELPIRPEWKFVDEGAKDDAKKRISEVEKLCTKK